MKTFKYRWKINSNEIIGVRDAENADSLEAHVKGVGGELVEVLEETQKAKCDRSDHGSSINTKKCSFCGEVIRAEAIKCKHCGEMLNRGGGFENARYSINHPDSYRPPRGSNNGLAIASFILGILSAITSAIGIGFLFAVIAVCLGPGGRDSRYSTLASWGIGLGWFVIIGSVLVVLLWGGIWSALLFGPR